jgi:hypothetical protein
MLVKSRPKFITLGILGAMMALLIVGLIYTQQSVQADGQVDTEVTVKQSESVPPVFECKWELPDMTLDQTANRVNRFAFYPDPDEVEYMSATRNEVTAPTSHGAHDDDAGNVWPSTQAARYPCQEPTGGGLPGQPDGVMNMITVKPLAHNPDDALIPQRMVQLWAALDQVGGISKIADVHWKIYEPWTGAPDNWKFKIKVHGTRVGAGDDDVVATGMGGQGDVTDPYMYNADGQIIGCCKVSTDHDNDTVAGTVGWAGDVRMREECRQLGTSTAAGTMFEAAHHSGQVSTDAIDHKDNGIVAKCIQGEKAVYYAKFSIDKDQACGKYKIVAHATNKSGGETTMTNYIDVVCFNYLSVDFSGISWGEITPGSMQVVSGDFTWDFSHSIATPGSKSPFGMTVHNGGNHGMGIKVSFSEMLQMQADGVTPIPGAATNGINKFDACFGKYDAFNIVCVGRNADDMIDPAEAPWNAVPTLFGPGNASMPGQGHDKGYQVLCANEFGKLDLSIHPRVGLPAGIYKGDVRFIAYMAHNPDMIGTPYWCDTDGTHVSHP